MDIYERVMQALQGGVAALTKEEWVALGDRLDGDSENGLLDLVNEHLEKIAPEVFGDVSEDGSVAKAE